MTRIETTGYIIQDDDGMAIYGIGKTVDEAWEEVVDENAPFFDRRGEPISNEEAFETQFKVYPATAALMAQVEDEGGAISWVTNDDIAMTDEEWEEMEEAAE
jgi:hypothetical protein